MSPELKAQIFTIVAHVPEGRVTSYGRIAAMTEGATARMVGTAMRQLPNGHGLPWHRVINASGKLADHAGAAEQQRLLKAEGINLEGRARVPAAFFWP